MENYVNAKLILLTLLKDDAVVILNSDDRYYERERAAAEGPRIVTYGRGPEADLRIEAVEGAEGGTKITLSAGAAISGAAGEVSAPGSTRETYTFISPMIGDFNAYNLTAAFCAMIMRGIPLSECIRRINRVRPIAGRMEVLDFGQPYQVILDYAHTPDAFKKILPYLAEHKKGRLITITGSAGGCEKEKRPEMGRLVLDYSDLVIFTMDDPRTESVDEIIDDLVSGSEKLSYLRVPDRKEAIWKALSMAEPDDTVLVAGKGRDNYMALGTEYLPYCDYDTIKEFYS